MARKRLSTELQLDTCDQDRPNGIKDELALYQNQHAVSSNRVVLAQTLIRLWTIIDEPPGTGTPTIVDTSFRLH